MVYVSNSVLLNTTYMYHLHSCVCTTLGGWVGIICSDTGGGGVMQVCGRLSEVEMLEVGRATGGDNPQPWVTPLSVGGQYMSLSC